MEKKYKYLENFGYTCSIASGLLIIYQGGMSLLPAFLAVVGVYSVVVAQSKQKANQSEAEE